MHKAKVADGVIMIDSEVPGPTLTIMGGVHGNEICGIKALDDLVNKIDLIRGKVYLIYANQRAIELGVRQVDMNLNRAFRPEELISEMDRQSYEYRRALDLMPFLKESVALLDIHSSTSIVSTPFIICEPHSFYIAEQLPFLVKSHGWDKIHLGGTDYYVNQNGGCGVCVECGYHLDPAAPQLAIKSAMIFLSLMHVINDSVIKCDFIDQKTIFAYEIYITEKNFIPARNFADFESLHKDELIGFDGKKRILAPFNTCIIFARRCDGAMEEAFVFGRFE